MIGEWWLLWMALMFVLLVPSLIYGWGFRKWGPPLPRWIQKRRASSGNERTAFDYRAWGWAGDMVWVVALIGAFWAGVLTW